MRERWTLSTENGRIGWASVPRDQVRKNLARVGVEPRDIELIEGDVVKTSASWDSSQEIAILRLDVDWELETRASLENLYPSLSVGGVLIVDDYGHHSGARQAVDEYFRLKPMRFSHVDYSCVVGVKLGRGNCHN